MQGNLQMTAFPCLCLQVYHILGFSFPERVETMLVSLTGYVPGLKSRQMTYSNGPAMLEPNTPPTPLQGAEAGRNLYLFYISSFT